MACAGDHIPDGALAALTAAGVSDHHLDLSRVGVPVASPTGTEGEASSGRTPVPRGPSSD